MANDKKLPNGDYRNIETDEIIDDKCQLHNKQGFSKPIKYKRGIK